MKEGELVPTFIAGKLVGIQPKGMTGIYAYTKNENGSGEVVPITRTLIQSRNDIV